MQVNKNVIENLYNDAGYERTKKAQKYRKEKMAVLHGSRDFDRYRSFLPVSDLMDVPDLI